MGTNLRKTWTLALSLVMALALIPTAALAEDVEDARASSGPGRALAVVTDSFSFAAPLSANDASTLDIQNVYEFAEPASNPLTRSLGSSEGTHVITVEADGIPTEELVATLESLPGVLMAEPDAAHSLEGSVAPGTPNYVSESSISSTITANSSQTDPLLSEQYALESTDVAPGGTNVQQLWSKLGYTSSQDVPADEQVVVAIIDSGVDYTNPDLANVMWADGDEAERLTGLPFGTYGYDLADEDRDVLDPEGHGTHVAGIVAAELGNDEGGAGMAPNARIMALKISDDDNVFVDSGIVRAYAYLKSACQQAGVNIVAANNSTVDLKVNPILKLVMNDALESCGIVSVCAAGNDSLDNDLNVYQPASQRSTGVVAVGAGNQDGSLADYSNYGVISTDIIAPGTDLLSTVPANQSSWVPTKSSTLASDDFEDDSGCFTLSVDDASPAGRSSAALNEGTVRWIIENGEAGQAFSLVSSPFDASACRDETAWIGFHGQVRLSQISEYDRILTVSVSSTDPDDPWVDLKPPISQSAALDYWGSLAFPITAADRARIDWENLSIRITRTIAAVDEGATLTFLLDNMTLASFEAVAPYAWMYGTSMATPVAAGAVALLSAAYPNDDAATRRARLMGSVTRDEALSDVCSSGGRLDLARAADPYPVVESATQARSDPSSLIIEGHFFGEAVGNVLVEGAGEASIASWSPERIEVSLPAGLSDAMRFVQVERASTTSDDPQTGRLRAFVAGTAAEVDSRYFESLPTPDFDALNVQFNDASGAWQVTEADGKLYCSGSFISHENEGTTNIAVLVYDPNTSAWTLDHTFDSIPFEAGADNVLLCSHGTTLYLCTSGALYRYDVRNAAGNAPRLICNDAVLSVPEYITLTHSAMVSDGTYVHLVGGLMEFKKESLALLATVEVSTGQTSTGPNLRQKRAWPNAQMLDGVLTVAGGGLFSLVEPTSERFVNGSFQDAAPLPASIVRGQAPQTASGAVPAGTELTAADGTRFTLKGEGLILTGLVNAEDENDTYVYDPTADTWTTLAARLSPVKVLYAGGAVANGSFYALGFDDTSSQGDRYGVVFKRFVFAEPSHDGDENDTPVALPAESSAAKTPAALAPTGDRVSPALPVVVVAGIAAAAGLVALRRRVR